MTYTITKAKKSAIKKLFGQVFNVKLPTLAKIKKQFVDFDFRYNATWVRLMDVLVDMISLNYGEVEVKVEAVEAKVDAKVEAIKKYPKMIPFMDWGKEGSGIPLPQNLKELHDELSLLFFDFQYKMIDSLIGVFQIRVNIGNESKLLAEFNFNGKAFLFGGVNTIEIKRYGRVRSIASLYNYVYEKYTRLYNEYYGLVTA